MNHLLNILGKSHIEYKVTGKKYTNVVSNVNNTMKDYIGKSSLL